LLAAVPQAKTIATLRGEQISNIGSQDMNDEVWLRLARRVNELAAMKDVDGIVITHGTDTIEETGYFLNLVVKSTKPVVLTAAMRPATAIQADGPQNLLDAVAVAESEGVRGVVAVVAGQVWSGLELRKTHSYRLDAFEAGPDAGPLAVVEEGVVRRFRDWPAGEALGAALLPEDATQWPWVEVLASHAGADARSLEAWRAAGLQGLVLACTGNGTVNQALEAPLQALKEAGVPVWRTTRCAQGRIVGASDEPAAALSPWAARVELMLSLLQR
jgi:L-asparaginase